MKRHLRTRSYIKILATTIATGLVFSACSLTRPKKFSNLTRAEFFGVIGGLTSSEQFGCARWIGHPDDSGSMTPAQTGMAVTGLEFAQAIEQASQGSQVVDFTGVVFKVSNYLQAATPGSLVPNLNQIYQSKNPDGTFNTSFTNGFSNALAPGITSGFGREHSLASLYYTLKQNIEDAAGGDIPYMPRDPNGDCATFFNILTDENLQSATLIPSAADYLAGISYSSDPQVCTFSLPGYSSLRHLARLINLKRLAVS